MFLFEFSIKKVILSLLTLSLFPTTCLNAIDSKEQALKILGLPQDATIEQITKAYRALARKYHPDLNQGSKSSQAIMQTINEARDFLEKHAATNNGLEERNFKAMMRETLQRHEAVMRRQAQERLQREEQENLQRQARENLRREAKENLRREQEAHQEWLHKEMQKTKERRQKQNKIELFFVAGTILTISSVVLIFLTSREMYYDYYNPENKDKSWKEIFKRKNYAELAGGIILLASGIFFLKKGMLLQKTA